jgi:hypothetical protein
MEVCKMQNGNIVFASTRAGKWIVGRYMDTLEPGRNQIITNPGLLDFVTIQQPSLHGAAPKIGVSMQIVFLPVSEILITGDIQIYTYLEDSSPDPLAVLYRERLSQYLAELTRRNFKSV